MNVRGVWECHRDRLSHFCLRNEVIGPGSGVGGVSLARLRQAIYCSKGGVENQGDHPF